MNRVVRPVLTAFILALSLSPFQVLGEGLARSQSEFVTGDLEVLAPPEFSRSATGYTPLTREEMRGFHWSIAGAKQKDFSANTRTFGRDLNWVIDHAQTIAGLRKRGKKVICYMNWGRLQSGDGAYEGAYSAYRSLDRKTMCKEPGDAWGEPWINLRGPENQRKAVQAWKRIIDRAKKHCDGLEYDNSDVYENIRHNACGSALDVMAMLRKTCEMTHAAGMNCILKNTFDKAGELADQFDGAIGEQCFTYSGNARKLAKAFGPKPVACVEYKNADVENEGAYRRDFAKDCASARALGLASLIVDRRQSVQGDPVMTCGL